MNQARTAAAPDLERAQPLTADELRLIDAYWRAANYLSVGQIYLFDNPLLKRPLRLEDITPRLLGHWGTTPGLNFIHAHANRLIKKRDLDAIYIMGPGHGGPAGVANAYLEGTYTERYPDVTLDETGLRKLFRQFSFPGGVPSHNAPETPGSIHEGGELGYALVHAYGAAFDNPKLTVFCIVGDGEAETGPLAASWHSNKFLNPARDGAVLPILHLNGYKIANPTLLARIPERELIELMRGYGHAPVIVSGDDPPRVHQQMAAALDWALDEIARIQGEAHSDHHPGRPSWPMIILRTPKGWTGPKNVDGEPIEGTFRAHQVPVTGFASDPSHVKILEDWLLRYRPEELFDKTGKVVDEVLRLPPQGDRRMSANPHANGGELLRDLRLPDFRDYAIAVARPGTTTSEATRVLGRYLRDVIKMNPDNFRIVGPDETESNRLSAVFEATNRTWDAEVVPGDDHLAPDANCLLSVADHCLRSRNYVNVMVAGKQPALNYLSMEDAIAHCTRGLGIWDWASTDEGRDPDVVLACAGDVPTLETLAAADLIRQHLPQVAVRFVNVVDLMRLQPPTEHPHGLRDAEFDEVFTADKPVIFAYHGYPWLIHRLTYRRTNHPNIHVRGYKEEGTTTTPFDMVMLNDLDRYHLVMDVIDRVPSLGSKAAHVRQAMVDQRLRARQYTRDHGEDAPEIVNWVWPQ